MDGTHDPVRDIIDRLEQPIPDLSTLFSLLSSPLDCLGILPPRFRRHVLSPLQLGSIKARKYLPALQRALLAHVVPTWDLVLVEEDATLLLKQYFCPDSFYFASPVAGEVALMAYSTLLSQPLTKPAIDLLAQLALEYPVDRLYSAVFPIGCDPTPTQMLAWEDSVRNVLAIPGKVSNAIAGKSAVPSALEHGTYYNGVSIRTESLILSKSGSSSNVSLPAISYLLNKLVNIGAFPPTPPISRSQPSFFRATLPILRDRIATDNAFTYSAMWSSLITALPSSLSLQSILTSLFAALESSGHASDPAPTHRITVKGEAILLSGITGMVTPDTDEVWESSMAIILGKDWDISHARVFVCWLSGGCQGGQVNEKALDAFIEQTLAIWSSPDHVKHSLLSRHKYITTLLLLAISYLEASSSSVLAITLSPVFITGVGLYVSHLDNSVRRCGMLAAEVVAQRAGKKLDFKDWDGNDSGKLWARETRELLKQRDVDADFAIAKSANIGPVIKEEGDSDTGDPMARATFINPTDGYDSDDSIAGYASPPSSRSASPTPSELDDIEKDPTLNVGTKKVSRPVYLAQLGDLLRSTGNKSSDDPHEADKIEMALDHAEELIRKKRGYGTELEENAVNLVYALIGLQDNYNLEGFETKRQGALNALISCAPKRAAPALIEEFFKNQYSTSQRYLALDALALGAREMASLPLPPSSIAPERISFPSKQLPGPMHQQYLTAGRQDAVALLTDSISSNAIEKGKEAVSDKVPEIVRERRLRASRPPIIVPVSSPQSRLARPQQISLPRLTPFTEVATEFFIGPLINRFWLFLRDERTREERTAYQKGRERYHSAGTGLILNPVVLSQYLRTLVVITHAAQNAPEWLAMVAPDALELAVTIGTRPVSHIETDDEDDEERAAQRGKEASVLTSALELALVVLDGCIEIDGGRNIGLEHTTLLLGAGEWAAEIFARLEQGLKMQGGGGIHEVKLKRAAAGVLLKVDKLTSKWRRSMLDTR